MVRAGRNKEQRADEIAWLGPEGDNNHEPGTPATKVIRISTAFFGCIAYPAGFLAHLLPF